MGVAQGSTNFDNATRFCGEYLDALNEINNNFEEKYGMIADGAVPMSFPVNGFVGGKFEPIVGYNITRPELYDKFLKRLKGRAMKVSGGHFTVGAVLIPQPDPSWGGVLTAGITPATVFLKLTLLKGSI
jgi:hypothetical protein